MKAVLKNLLDEIERAKDEGMLDHTDNQFEHSVLSARIHLWISEHESANLKCPATELQRVFWSALDLVKGRAENAAGETVDHWWCTDEYGHIYDPCPDGIVKYISPVKEPPPQQKAIQSALDCSHPIIREWAIGLLRRRLDANGGSIQAVAKELDVPLAVIREWCRGIK
jgi:hypothetical protein